jgi:FkbM family methyltransferase
VAAYLPRGVRDRLGLLLIALGPRRIRPLRRIYAATAYEFVRSLYLTDRRPLTVEVALTTGTRLQVDLKSKTGRHLAFDREHEPDVARLMDQLYMPGTVALDIGANVGYFSTFLGSLGAQSGGKVLAFEPFESNYLLLATNIALNNLTTTVMPCQIALASEQGQSTYHINPLNDGGGGLRRARPEVSDGNRMYSLEQIRGMGFTDLETVVETVTLDTWLLRPEIEAFIGENQNVSLVKCDVEGGELEVLQGAEFLIEGTMDGSHPVWIVEISADVEEIFQMFELAGYSAFESLFDGPRPVTQDTITSGANALFIHTDDERLKMFGKAE